MVKIIADEYILCEGYSDNIHGKTSFVTNRPSSSAIFANKNLLIEKRANRNGLRD